MRLRRLRGVICVAFVLAGGGLAGHAIGTGEHARGIAHAEAPVWVPGNFWQFDLRYAAKGRRERDVVVHSVLASPRVKGTPLFALASVRKTPKGVPVDAELVYLTPDFVAVSKTDDGNWALHGKLWAFPLRPGDRFVDELKRNRRAGTARVGTAKRVQTRAGAFDAIPIRHSTGSTNWFAPRAGFDVVTEAKENRLRAELARWGRVADPTARFLGELDRIQRGRFQDAKVAAIRVLGQLARLGPARARARRELSQFTRDRDAFVRSIAAEELRALARGRRAAHGNAPGWRGLRPANIGVIGEIIGVVDSVWSIIERVTENREKRIDVQIKHPESTEFEVELGTVIQFPWEIDYSIKPQWGTNRPDLQYFCLRRVYVEDTLVKEVADPCTNGIDMPILRPLAVVARQWRCGASNSQRVRIEAWVELVYYAWVFTERGVVVWKHRGPPPGELEKDEARQEMAKRNAAVKFTVYNPFYFTEFKLDQDYDHRHHAGQPEISVTVKVRKRAEYQNPASTTVWGFDKATSWRFFEGVVQGDRTGSPRHHEDKQLAVKEAGEPNWETSWPNESTPHVGIAEPHHPGERTEEWRVRMRASGLRNLGSQEEGTAAPVEWGTEVRDTPERQAGNCYKDTQIGDADPPVPH